MRKLVSLCDLCARQSKIVIAVGYYRVTRHDHLSVCFTHATDAEQDGYEIRKFPFPGDVDPEGFKK